MQFKRSLLTHFAIILASFLFSQQAYSEVFSHYNTEENTVAEDNTAFGLINDLVTGNTAFALDIYAQLKNNNNSGNLFFSPYSLSTALAMTYVGAKGATQAQMSTVLHFPRLQEKLHPAFSQLQEQINQAQKNVVLSIANALWGQKAYPFIPAFKEDVKLYYQANLKSADFTNPELIRQEINTWVESKTNDKIKDLVKQGVITELTRLALVNAIYFKGDWAYPFTAEKTKSRPFWLNNNDSVEVSMMTQKNYFEYQEIEEDNLEILGMPYGTAPTRSAYDKNNLSMIILLPEKRNGLAQLENSLTPEKLDTWLRWLRIQKVNVSLPKFKINSGFELSKPLSEMGMPDAFSPDNADFSGIDGTRDLSISSVIHQAFVEVNEQGTEAAAATAVFATTRGLPAPTPEFRADHPFIFLIRHNSSGSILFMGRVMNP
ncbi:MAG: serpin family protein [Candidatus Parabeggiatoa sp. nov. 3]|nr:MAG: serpin family protein [Gammaproteobacteria bacterium]RKZ58653.1 MAG: serpin family protein [Gammaproteobacteria bacterium]RKZ81914.1 MAG: serpin family protein [Gammaproteobacteria bacterium]HEW98440.1 serpin family protein [Beggiatoa sp.]